MYDNWSCLEQFGGGCDCAGQSACYWYTHGGGAGGCTDGHFSGWRYAVDGVCHQSANQVARHHNGGIMGYSVRGMSWSVGIWGNYGSGSLC